MNWTEMNIIQTSNNQTKVPSLSSWYNRDIGCQIIKKQKSTSDNIFIFTFVKYIKNNKKQEYQKILVGFHSLKPFSAFWQLG